MHHAEPDVKPAISHVKAPPLNILYLKLEIYTQPLLPASTHLSVYICVRISAM